MDLYLLIRKTYKKMIEEKDKKPITRYLINIGILSWMIKYPRTKMIV